MGAGSSFFFQKSNVRAKGIFTMGYERKDQLARSVTLALTTGLFSIVPVVAEGAPVVDQIVTNGTSVEQNGKVTDVTSTVQNNIVNWKDFSVAQDETVRFDKGAQTNNYLNVVTGSKQSEIAGTVEGGKNVYIVNQHGVLIDKGATVNVGNLYVSTTTPETLDTKAYLATGASPLVNTASAAAADVTNMGKIQANTVTVEGGVVKFLDTADVSATGEHVTITAKTAQIGQQAKAATASNSTGIRRAMATPSTTGNSYHVTADQIDNFTTIASASDFDTYVRQTPSGKYWLKNDIDMSEITSYTPISGFSGVLDGNFYSVKNLTTSGADPVGLFSTITGTDLDNNPAQVYDLGIRNVNISFSGEDVYSGGLAGSAVNAKITNVYVSGGKIQTGKGTGGILGYAENVRMDSVYNTAQVSDDPRNDEAGAGFIASLGGSVTITNAYNAGQAYYGYYYDALGSNNTLTYIYDNRQKSLSTADSSGEAIGITGEVKIPETEDSSYYSSSIYKNKGWDISSSGEDNEDGTATTWRIYEGETLPLLRAFLRANGKVTVNYEYEMGDSSDTNFKDYYQSHSNNGADVTEKYNSQAFTIKDGTTPTFTNTTYGGTVTSGISTDTSGIQYYDGKTHAVFYTDQDGYDLVGNNVTIEQRTVTLDGGSLPGGSLSKEYDGTVAVDKDKLAAFLTSASTETASGLIPTTYDSTYTISYDGLSGTYDDKNVGTGKTITISGGMTVNNSGTYKNYNFVDTSGAATNTVTYDKSTINGIITPKKLTIKLASTNPTREYTGKENTAVDADHRLTGTDKTGQDGAIFTLEGLVKSGDVGVDGSTKADKDDSVAVKTTATGGTGDYGKKNDDGTFTKLGTAGTHDVLYEGIELDGTDATNYTLVDADGNALTNNKFYTTGTIDPKTISTDAFIIKDAAGNTVSASREYDNTQYFDLGSDQTLTTDELETYTDNGTTKTDDVVFTLTDQTSGSHAGHKAWFTQSTTADDGTTTTSDAFNKGTGYDITYNVQVSGADAGNYRIKNSDGSYTTFSSTEKTDAEVTGSKGSGEIKARTLYLTANKGVDKYYDGDNKVRVNGNETLAFDGSSDGYIVYDYTGSDAASAHQLLTDDGSKITITGTYADPEGDVLWENGSPKAQDITYQVTLSGDNTHGGNAADNYVVYNGSKATAASTDNTVTGVTGTINPRKITALTFDDVSKTYDGKNTVGGVQANDKINLTKVTLDTSDGTSLSTNDDGLIGTTDSIATIFNTDDITGTYGEYDTSSKTFTVNQHADETGDQGGHVKLDTDGKTPAKQDVRFSGIALKNGEGNYVLAIDDATSTTENGSTTFYGVDQGLITPLTVKNPTLKLKDSVSKVYNATSYVTITEDEAKLDGQNSAYNAADNVASVTATTDSGTEIALTPNLTKLEQTDAYYTTTTTTDGTTTTAATADATDNNGATGVTYNLTFQATDNPDYTIDGLGTDNKLAVAATLENGQTATITKRTLTPTIVKTGLTKTYDATQALTDASGNTLADGDTLVTFDGWLKNASGANADANVSNTSTGVYTTDGNVWHTNGDLSTTANHSITYTAQIDGTNKGNYTIATSTGFTKTSDTVATYDDTTGMITKRETGVTFGARSKVYDGTTNTGVTGETITGDAYAFDNLADADKNQNTLTLSYDSAYKQADVFTAKDGVNYTNLAFGDSDAARGNYTLKDTSATGEGSITTLALTKDNVKVIFKTNDPFVKTYDGKTSVAYDHTATNADGYTFFSDLGEETDSRTAESYVDDITLGGVSLKDLAARNKKDSEYTVKSATYNSADASATDGDKTVSYAFTLDDSLKNNFDFSGLKGATLDNSTTTLFDDSTNQLNAASTGTINAKYVKATFDDTAGGNTTDGQVTKVYNGKTNVVTNTQDAPTGTSLKDTSALMGKITYVGRIGSDTVASIDGAYEDKNVGTTKKVTYTLTNTNSNYKLVNNGDAAADAKAKGEALTYDGTGAITAKNITATFGAVTKTYDTTKALNTTVDASGKTTDATGFGATLADADKQANESGTKDDVTITADETASQYTDANAGTNKQVTYVFTLGGTDVGNYTLANTGVTSNTDGSYSVTTDGNTIKKKTLNAISIGFNTLEKTYDGSDSIKYDHTGDSYFAGYDDKDTKNSIDFIENITLDGHKLTKGTDYTVDETQTKFDSADAGSRMATFLFDFDDSVLGNYDIKATGFTTDADGKGHYKTSTSGTINAKYVKTSFTDSPVTKVYDGGTTLTADGTELPSSTLFNNVTYSGLIGSDTKDGISTITGAYNSKDVTGTDNPATDNVTYTLTNTSGNYKLVKDNATATDAVAQNGTLTYTGEGTITPKGLTIDFGYVEKTYNNDADVTTSAKSGDKTAITPTLTGFVSGEGVQFDDASKALIKGVYGTYDATNGIQKDANVNYDASTKKTGYKGVVYTGLADAFAKLTEDNKNTLKNYELTSVSQDGNNAGNASFVSAKNNGVKDTVYFAQGAQKGKIKQLALAAGDVKTRWKDYTRDYDGTSTISDYRNALNLYVDSAKGISLGKDANGNNIEIGIKYDGSAYFTNLSTGEKQKDQGTNLGITAKIDGIQAQEFNNFVMDDSFFTNIKGKEYKNTDDNGTTRGTITARHLVAITNDGADFDKVYDGTADVLNVQQPAKFTVVHIGKDADGNAVIEDAILDSDKNTVNAAVTKAYYTDSTGAHDANVDGVTSNDTSPHHIYYKGTVTGDDAGNYVIGNGNGTDTKAQTYTLASDGKTIEDTTDTTGHITARPVYVQFDPTPDTSVTPSRTKGTGIDKTYDGTTDVASQYKNDVALVAEDATTKTGLVADDVKAGLKLDNDKINVVYDDKNVARDDDGNVTTKNVYFSNFQLTGNDTKAKNYQPIAIAPGSKQSDDGTKLIGSGTISPATVTVTYDNVAPVRQEYTGESAFTTDTQKTLADAMKNNAAGMVAGEGIDTLGLSVTGDYTYDGKKNIHTNEYLTDATGTTVADGDLGLSMSVAWTNGNYDVVFAPTNTTTAAKTLTQDATATAQKASDGTVTGFAKTVTTTQGTITPKTLTMAGGTASKTYDGKPGIEASLTGEDAPGNTNAPITFDGIVDHDKNANSIADLGTAKGTFYYKGTAHTADNEVADANDNETDNDTERDVEWTVTLTNKDYRLADDGTMTGTVTGTGVIKRAELTFASNPVQSRFGQTPTFTGTVTGWANGEGDSFDKTSVTWNTAPGTSVRGTSSAPIYGWYRYDDQTGAGTSWSYDTTKTSNGADIYATDGVDGYRNFGNYGKNYTIVQQPGQFTSQADRPDGLDDVLNPARRVRPDMEVYNHVTHDDVGTVIRDPKAGIEYQAGGTSLSTDGSASYAGTMTVEGAGEVVNLTQSGTTASADRVDLTNDGANYTLSGAENVPTADVTVADVTEDVASATTTASATAAAGTTSATSATNADDTTVTDDDDDAVKAAAESSDEREAEATVEYADQAPSLFSEAITGTNVAS